MWKPPKKKSTIRLWLPDNGDENVNGTCGARPIRIICVGGKTKQLDVVVPKLAITMVRRRRMQMMMMMMVVDRGQSAGGTVSTRLGTR